MHMKIMQLALTPPMQPERISNSQRDRLAYIEFRLYFLGEIRRQDLISRFGVGPAGATRDFAKYKELYPENISFDSSTKAYVIGKNFAPTYEHVPERVLTALTQGFGDGVNSTSGALLTCEFPMMFNRPTMSVLAPVTRAINLKKAVKLRYYSHTSGATERVIVPFALVNDGLRWHVRAFDRKSKDFRDFVFTRMEATSVVEDTVIENHELSAADIQWNRILEIDLIPHPAREHPEIIEHDYGMTSGVLHVEVRAAIAGYLLRLWIVDCSPNHILEGEEYRLCLKDELVLYGVSSAIFAPGYKSPRNAKEQ